ncbi:N-formylglutamate amidohydrolase [Parvularcula oceani]|uniref:N-formylglutamate amidohydrolase n=1 Tax=Parvularcula oceani TaxID=1247963 RepID=UPI0006907841|nr:N-formylglutamate amidohydrolase [Parvularcula oceani]
MKDDCDAALRPHWDIQRRGGPVLATAVHAGHVMRDELKPYLAISEQDQRREEDPMTGLWSTVGDDAFRNYTSRFQADLNRPRDSAIYLKPEDSWGLQVWKETPPDEMIERSLAVYDAFYDMMATWIEGLIAECGKVLVLDIHSYNHRRDGPHGRHGPQEDNPDIDLGVTTLDRERFGGVLDVFKTALAAQPAQSRELDVRENVRYPDGGHWPEWVFANYGADVATITLEYKKFYMDEWTGTAFLPVIEDLRAGLDVAACAARKELLSCR